MFVGYYICNYKKLKGGIEQMEVNLNYCNNIDEGKITIHENQLNLKYGINGTGKTTISKAIEYYVDDVKNGTNNLKDLKPFKYYNNDEFNSQIVGIEDIKNVKIFDEKYIEQFLFLEDELVKGSFDIFVYSEEYQKGIDEINGLIEAIAQAFETNKELDELMKDFDELSGSFGRPIATGIHGSSKIAKALKEGNKIANIPQGLEDYEDFLKLDDNFKWIKWQIDGNNYLDISTNCPYCTSNIEDKKEKIISVKKQYNPKDIEHLNNLVAVFQELDKYFSEETRRVINDFITNINGYTDDQVKYLLDVKSQIDRLSERLYKIKKINFESLKDVDRVVEQIKEYKINLDYLNHLNSEETREKIGVINSALEQIEDKAGKLQGEVNKQKILLEKTIRENKEEINSFLTNAGYDYYVDILEEDDTYKLKLIHKDYNGEINNAKLHLSFGERNAFALVLFMYEALKEDPDLIILDDPISSFDSSKKYAVIDMLFKRENKSLRNKTVLMLTHDFDPILDMVYHHRNRFQLPRAYFLENNNGKLIEKQITNEDIKTFLDILKENAESAEEDINKLIYLRKLYEFDNNKGIVYQLLSNLFHKRDTPFYKEYVCTRNYKNKIPNCSLEMNEVGINIATKEIRKYVPEFEYFTFLEIVNDTTTMIELYNKSGSNYEKLQIYRIINDDKEDNDIIKKFINESYHIENDYIYQLNPCNYQTIPQFIIDECDKKILEIQSKFQAAT